MDDDQARRKAIWLLSRFNYHSEVLKRKLVEKGCSKETACKVIADCKRIGILNDEDALLREFRRGLGPRAIQYKFRIEAAAVRKVITREMQKNRIAETFERSDCREKTYRTLFRKGFDPELIIEIFSFRD